MKVEAGDVHFLGSDGDVKTIEPCENSFMHLRIDLRTLALGPEFRKGLAFEGSDHTTVCKQLAYACQERPHPASAYNGNSGSRSALRFAALVEAEAVVRP